VNVSIRGGSRSVRGRADGLLLALGVVASVSSKVSGWGRDRGGAEGYNESVDGRDRGTEAPINYDLRQR
jgi:hypothetical protein